MWIPYDLRDSLKAETKPETIRMSQLDSREREFLVGFYLRNPVTQSWELDLVADAAPFEFALGADMPDASVNVIGNEAGKLGEIIYRLSAASAGEALLRAHADLQRRLLRYVAEVGRGMAIGGWRIADMAHGAQWRCTPFRPSAMKVDYPALGPVDDDLAPLVELFQRARNASDAASRLMAAYAVLRAALHHPAMARSGAGTVRVTQEMLIHSGAVAYPAPLHDLTLDALIGILRPVNERYIGPDGVLLPVFEDLPEQRLLAQLANLADLIAHRLILAEIRARARPAEPARSRTRQHVEA